MLCSEQLISDYNAQSHRNCDDKSSKANEIRINIFQYISQTNKQTNKHTHTNKQTNKQKSPLPSKRKRNKYFVELQLITRKSIELFLFFIFIYIYIFLRSPISVDDVLMFVRYCFLRHFDNILFRPDRVAFINHAKKKKKKKKLSPSSDQAQSEARNIAISFGQVHPSKG